jgi:hypothetical protein
MFVAHFHHDTNMSSDSLMLEFSTKYCGGRSGFLSAQPVEIIAMQKGSQLTEHYVAVMYAGLVNKPTAQFCSPQQIPRITQAAQSEIFS